MSYLEASGFSAESSEQTDATLAAGPTAYFTAPELASALASKDDTTTRAQELEGAKWNTKVITYNLPAGVNGGTINTLGSEQYFLNAIKEMSAATGIKFEQVTSKPDINFIYGGSALPPVEYSGFVDATTAHVVHGAITSATISLIDPTWLAESGAGVQVQQEVLQGLGHALGLNDNADPHSVMYYALSPSNLGLDQTDLKNLATLYKSHDACGTGAVTGTGAYWDHQALLAYAPQGHHSA